MASDFGNLTQSMTNKNNAFAEKITNEYGDYNIGLPQGWQSNYLPEHRPSGYKKYNVNNFTPGMMQAWNQMFGLVGPDSQQYKLAMGDQSGFEQMEAPALQQFNQLQGGLASRFSGQGMGSRHSSGFKNASNAAAQDFAMQLQANRQNLQRQAAFDLQGLTSGLFQNSPYTTGFAQKGDKGGNLGGWGAAGGTVLGGIAGYYTGDTMGGAQMGYAAGSAFD